MFPPPPPPPPLSVCSYIFCSILHCDKHPEVPLMNIKHCTEQYLAASGLNYTIFRLCGFMQARSAGRVGGGVGCVAAAALVLPLVPGEAAVL